MDNQIKERSQRLLLPSYLLERKLHLQRQKRPDPSLLHRHLAALSAKAAQSTDLEMCTEKIDNQLINTKM
jgi:hypothetical protein